MRAAAGNYERRAWSELVKEKRIELGLNQTNFGKQVGARKNTVWSWEKARSRPSSKYQIALANLYELRLDGLRQLHNRRVVRLQLEDAEVGEPAPPYDDITAVVLSIQTFLELDETESFKAKRRNEPLLDESAGRCRAHVDGFLTEWRKLQPTVRLREDGETR